MFLIPLPVGYLLEAGRQVKLAGSPDRPYSLSQILPITFSESPDINSAFLFFTEAAVGCS